MEPEYRRPLVLSELLGFRADIVCLQEVDEKAFTAYLAPQLAQEGEFVTAQRPGSQPGLGQQLCPAFAGFSGCTSGPDIFLNTAPTCYLSLPAAGYRGVYTNKAGKAGLSVREGSATFFRSCRFSLLDQRSLTLKHLFPAEVGGWAGRRAGG